MKIKITKIPNSNKLAYGGEKNPLGGADFTNGITFINEGGTHEQNPIGGVLLGVDKNNTPNLVEEGEVIWKDYVFSNRLTPTKKLLQEYGLPEKYKDYTFAKIAEKLQEESVERPNDIISNKGLQDSMQTLIAIQENIREKKNKNISNIFSSGGTTSGSGSGSSTSLKDIIRRITQRETTPLKLASSSSSSSSSRLGTSSSGSLSSSSGKLGSTTGSGNSSNSSSRPNSSSSPSSSSNNNASISSTKSSSSYSNSTQGTDKKEEDNSNPFYTKRSNESLDEDSNTNSNTKEEYKGANPYVLEEEKKEAEELRIQQSGINPSLQENTKESNKESLDDDEDTDFLEELEELGYFKIKDGTPNQNESNTNSSTTTQETKKDSDYIQSLFEADTDSDNLDPFNATSKIISKYLSESEKETASSNENNTNTNTNTNTNSNSSSTDTNINSSNTTTSTSTSSNTKDNSTQNSESKKISESDSNIIESNRYGRYISDMEKIQKELSNDYNNRKISEEILRGSEPKNNAKQNPQNTQQTQPQQKSNKESFDDGEDTDFLEELEELGYFKIQDGMSAQKKSSSNEDLENNNTLEKESFSAKPVNSSEPPPKGTEEPFSWTDFSNSMLRMAPVFANIANLVSNLKKPDYSEGNRVVEAANAAPISNIQPNLQNINIRPIDRNYLLSKVRNQGNTMLRNAQNVGLNSQQALANMMLINNQIQQDQADALFKADEVNLNRMMQEAAFNRENEQIRTQSAFQNFANNLQRHRGIVDATKYSATHNTKLNEARSEGILGSLGNIGTDLYNIGSENTWATAIENNPNLLYTMSGFYKGMPTIPPVVSNAAATTTATAANNAKKEEGQKEEGQKYGGRLLTVKKRRR